MWHTGCRPRYYWPDSCWINLVYRCRWKWVFLFLESPSLTPHINKTPPPHLAPLTQDVRESWLHFVAFHRWYLFFAHWIKAHHVELLSGGLFAFCKRLVCLLFHCRAYLDQTFNSAVTLVSSKDLPAFVLLSIPFFFPQSMGVKWVASFIFLSFPIRIGEVFYRLGEKQWGQGRALWWQKCIFNACEWMEPPHSTAAGPSLNGSTNTAVFITHYWPVPFNHGHSHLPSPSKRGVTSKALP